MTAMIMAGIALFCTAITAVFSILAYAKVVGMEKSTHQIQYVPAPVAGGESGPTGKDLLKGFMPEDDEIQRF